MRKNNNSLMYMLCFIVLSLLTLSCSKDNSSDDITLDPSGSYWPLKTSNYWELYDEENDEYQNYDIYHTINYQGKQYFSLLSEEDEYNYSTGFREENGVFKMYFGPHTQQGVKFEVGVITYMNLNLPVNQEWVDNMSLDFTSAMGSGKLNYTYKGKVTEKKSAEIVDGKTYKDVIKTEILQTVHNTHTGNTYVTTTKIWLAKGVGPIRIIDIIEGETLDYSLKYYGLN